jgi:hypothetical protein
MSVTKADFEVSTRDLVLHYKNGAIVTLPVQLVPELRRLSNETLVQASFSFSQQALVFPETPILSLPVARLMQYMFTTT